MKKIVYLILLTMLANSGYAYELATHAAMTKEAYARSVLANDSQRLKELGITDGAAAFGDKYYDVSDAGIVELSSHTFEDSIILKLGSKPLSIVGWLMRGSIREDDSPGEGNPVDPVNPGLRRPLHHFYDPYCDRPLYVSSNRGLINRNKQSCRPVAGESNLVDRLDPDVHKAPNWAIGTADAFSLHPNEPETGRRNHFAIFDATEAMYRALTSGTEEVRNKYWATTFRALGDAVHLVQDMAQPQHTRNDPHSGKGISCASGSAVVSSACKLANELIQNLLTGHSSVYEHYIDARAKGEQFYKIDGTVVPVQGLAYSGYDVPRFVRFSDYWSSRSEKGAGLADYSNRGFFSVGTNLGENEYLSPSNDPGAYTKVLVTDPTLVSGVPFLKKNFLLGDVEDYQFPRRDNIRMTTESVFAFFTPTYTLNRFNYDDMAALLAPRAVSYSTGLLDYFFRGRLSAEVSNQGGSLRISVTNISGPENSLKNGSLEVYYDANDGTRKPLSGSLQQIAGLADGESLIIAAANPGDLDTKSDAPFIIVFNGLIGKEKGIATILLSKSRPSGFIYVADFCNQRVQVFTKTGEAVAQFGSLDNFVRAGGLLSPDNLMLAYPVVIAVDDEQIYVGNAGGQEGISILTKNGNLVSHFGSFGQGQGEFWGITGIAVDTTYMYVADDNIVKRVQIFTKNGTYISQFGSTGSETGQFSRPAGIAVDQSYIFVTDEYNPPQVFTKSGVFLLRFPLSGAPATINPITVDDIHVYIGNGSNVLVLTKDGKYVSQFSTSGFVGGLAADSQYVYATDNTNHQVNIYSKIGQLVMRFGSFGRANGEFCLPYGIAVD